MKEKSLSEKLHGRCIICGRINKPNHNVVCGLRPNKRRRAWESLRLSQK